MSTDKTTTRARQGVVVSNKMDKTVVVEVTRRDERHALGYFLELAGRLGGDASLEETAKGLNDGRRRRARLFFAGPRGRYQLAATRRNTPPEALRWGYLMNVGLDSFKSTFDKFAETP